MSLESTTETMAAVKDYLDRLLLVAGLEGGSTGLLIEGRSLVAKVGLAVNCSFEVIDEAANRACDLLVTYYGLQPSTNVHLVEAKHSRLSQAALNLYVTYDALDCAREFGAADALARATQVVIQAPFRPDAESECAVHGVTTGHWQEFVGRVENRLGRAPRAWKNCESFGHVAVVPGFGARPEWMARAQALGCDTYLSGEALLPGILFAREAGLNLILSGNYVTYMPGVMALSARIARDLKLDVTFIPETMVEDLA